MRVESKVARNITSTSPAKAIVTDSRGQLCWCQVCCLLVKLLPSLNFPGLLLDLENCALNSSKTWNMDIFFCLVSLEKALQTFSFLCAQLSFPKTPQVTRNVPTISCPSCTTMPIAFPPARNPPSRPRIRPMRCTPTIQMIMTCTEWEIGWAWPNWMLISWQTCTGMCTSAYGRHGWNIEGWYGNVWHILFAMWQCVKTLYPCSSHQNSW